MKIIRKEFIYNEPLVTPSCHASTLLKFEDKIIAAWFGGKEEGAKDVKIWLSIFENGSWSEPKTISKEENIPHWNPVLMQKDNEIHLFYKVGFKIPFWQTYLTVSKNGGKTFSEPCELIKNDVSGGRGPVKNKALKISDGSILAPASTEQGLWRPFIDKYRENWEKKIIPASEDVGLIQPSLWESEKGHIHALMRSNKGYIYRSDSFDFGENWCEAYKTGMPNNNSGIDCVKASNSNIYLVCNPVKKNRGARSPLTLFLSKDNGENFTKLCDLETMEGEFSYPAIISEKSRLYITYTWNRQKIAFTEIEL